jgi:AAA15 family ATPase/GTPase
MITKIELKNFKSHAHTVIEPGRVTALVGPNGAGKSTVLQALSMLMDLAGSSSALKVDPTKKILKEGADSLELKISGVEKQSRWSLGLLSSNKELAPLREHPNIKLPAWGIFLAGEFNGELGYLAPITEYSLGAPIPQAVFKAVGEYSSLKASAANLAAPSYSEEIPPRISTDGHGLASLFAYLLGNSRKIIEQIEASLKLIVPTIKQVGFTSAKITRNETKLITFNETTTAISDPRQVTGEELIFDTTSADGVPASEMSDGTLLALGLLTLLWSPSSPQLILLDDIETGLHPLAQRQLMQVLKDFAEKHDRQIILTSHSPYIIDELDAKDVWVMATDSEGISHTKRLSEHPDAERALSVLTTGEFASAEGEEWVIENKTPAEMVNA